MGSAVGIMPLCVFEWCLCCLSTAVLHGLSRPFGWLQVSSECGVSVSVHVLIATYNEPADLVKECVLRLLVAPEPIFMEKIIWICDDGYMKEEGKQKQRLVADLQSLGALPSCAMVAGLICLGALPLLPWWLGCIAPYIRSTSLHPHTAYMANLQCTPVFCTFGIRP
jgi:hypothetical protein